MGRRNKGADKNSETIASQPENFDAIEKIQKNKQSKKRKSNQETLDLINQTQIKNEATRVTEVEDSQSKEEKPRSKKKLKQNSKDQKSSGSISIKSKIINHTEEAQVENKKEPILNKKRIKQSERNKFKNKKIIFEDDTGEPVEVSKNGSYNIANDDIKEEEVKDEDIDQFCVEITEEDNAQYENWVQLIEAKLKSNTNKHKSKK